MRKRGAGLDLAIAVVILRADRVPPLVLCGELSLSGGIALLTGIVSLALALRAQRDTSAIVSDNQRHQCVQIPNFSYGSRFVPCPTSCRSSPQRTPQSGSRSSSLHQQTNTSVDVDLSDEWSSRTTRRETACPYATPQSHARGHDWLWLESRPLAKSHLRTAEFWCSTNFSNFSGPHLTPSENLL